MTDLFTARYGLPAPRRIAGVLLALVSISATPAFAVNGQRRQVDRPTAERLLRGEIESRDNDLQPSPYLKAMYLAANQVLAGTSVSWGSVSWGSVSWSSVSWADVVLEGGI